MTDRFPFSAERLAQLARLSREINARGALAPIARPISIEPNGFACVPLPEGCPALMKVHPGVRVAWSPLPDQDGVLLMLFGGALGPDELADSVVAIITRDGLRRMAADLTAIADMPA